MVCDGVDGPNLVSDALACPARSGLGGAAVARDDHKADPGRGGHGRRLGRRRGVAARSRPASRRSDSDAVAAIASGLGADVPSQLAPGPLLGTGAGETLAPPRRSSRPTACSCSRSRSRWRRPTCTARRTAWACRGPPTSCESLRARRWQGRSRPELVVNDLQPAALSLAPGIGDALEAALRAGADQAIVCGSGPTVIGLFWGADGASRARAAAAGLRGAHPGAVAAEPVRGGDGSRRRTNERLPAICAGSEPWTPVMTTFRHNLGCET